MDDLSRGERRILNQRRRAGPAASEQRGLRLRRLQSVQRQQSAQSRRKMTGAAEMSGLDRLDPAAVNTDGVSVLVTDVCSQRDMRKLRGLLYARPTEAVTALLAAPQGGLDWIVKSVSGDTDLARGSEAVHCLDIVSSVAPNAVVEFVPGLIACVTSAHCEAGAANALMSLAMLTGQGPLLRNIVVDNGAGTLFVNALASSVQSVVDAAVYGLSALSRGQEAKREEISRACASQICAHVDRGADHIDTVPDLIWLVVTLACHGEDAKVVDVFLEAGVYLPLAKALPLMVQAEKWESEALTPLLRAIGIFTDAQAAKNNGVPALWEMSDTWPQVLDAALQCTTRAPARTAATAMALVADLIWHKPPADVWVIVCDGRLECLLTALGGGSGETKAEAVEALCGLARFSDKGLDLILNSCLSDFVRQLASKDDDVVLNVLDILSHFVFNCEDAARRTVEECPEIELLEPLLYHSNQEIEMMANQISNRLYDDEDEAIDYMQPVPKSDDANVTADAFTFGPPPAPARFEL